jgi:hypothetical protein
MVIIKYKLLIMVTVKVKCKRIPVHLWTGPENSRMLRLPDFKL